MVRSSLRLAKSLLAATALLVSAPHTLREAADSQHILIGAAVRPSLFSEPAYAETLGREFNMLEPENDMKWAMLRPNRETFDFHAGDEIVAFAKAHGMKVRGHCLVWDHMNPDWLVQGKFTPAQLSDLLQKHIAGAMQHYAGQVFAWDVVNEAFESDGHVKDSIWHNQPGIGLAYKGTAYVEQAFRWAHEADPHALLFYNEAEGEGMNRKSDAVYAMVKDFKQRGVPIDGVGLQMHISRLDYDAAPVSDNIARLTALGVQVHITELDISLPVDAKGQVTNTNDVQRQADLYRDIVRACLQHPGCTAIQMWGFTDKYSWIGSHSHHTRGAALPFDRDYRPKAAYNSLLGEFSNSRKQAGP